MASHEICKKPLLGSCTANDKSWFNDNGCTYTGGWLDGRRDGTGTLLHPNGTIYVGDWSNGYCHGKGMWRHPKGCNYYGYWKNGNKNGKGELFCPSLGRIIIGEWVNDWFNREEATLANNETGYGEFYKHELLLHSNMYRVEKNSHYFGSLQKGLFHGYGIMYFPCGSKYEGDFSCGMKHGYGMLIISAAKYIVGWWELDQVHGEAIYSSGELYIHGKWSKGELAEIISSQKFCEDTSLVIINC